MPSRRSDPASRAIEHVRALSRGGPVDRSLRVHLHFHPDRETGGRTVLQHLAADGVYRSQFETHTSNGGLTAHAGGDRWRWEHRIFGGAYDDAEPAQRPKYGALDHRRRHTGAAPRFGSCYLRLTEAALDRTTFCFPDSVFDPESFGTADRCDLARLADAFAAVGRTDREEAEQGGRLDDYIEAHTHGVLELADDVEALVLDPCYRDTVIEEQALTLEVPLEWHAGFAVDLSVVQRHPDFRGPQVVAVAESVAVAGRLDARIIGAAVLRGDHDPQDLKKVWHHVARFGAAES